MQLQAFFTAFIALFTKQLIAQKVPQQTRKQQFSLKRQEQWLIPALFSKEGGSAEPGDLSVPPAGGGCFDTLSDYKHNCP